MIHSEIPNGYKVEWRIDPDFFVVEDFHYCSFNKCDNVAVAYLRRTFRRNGNRTRRQFCCEEHMYGREIRGDGTVVVDCLVETGQAPSGAGRDPVESVPEPRVHSEKVVED